MNDENTLELHIQRLLEEMGLGDISDEEKKEIADMLERTIDAKMKAFLMSELSDEEVEKLNEMSDDDVIKYFEEEKGIDFDMLIISIAQESREELLQDVAYIQGQIDARKGGDEA